MCGLRISKNCLHLPVFVLWQRRALQILTQKKALCLPLLNLISELYSLHFCSISCFSRGCMRHWWAVQQSIQTIHYAVLAVHGHWGSTDVLFSCYFTHGHISHNCWGKIAELCLCLKIPQAACGPTPQQRPLAWHMRTCLQVDNNKQLSVQCIDWNKVLSWTQYQACT